MNSLMKDTYVKSNLGNLSLRLLILLLSIVILHAEDFTYTFNIDKQAPYVKEPVVLTLSLNQTNHDLVMFFNFSIKKSKDYTFQRINIQESDSYHNAKVRYFYLLYPLRSGDINITFDLVQKTTTDESIAFSIAGDRDHVEGITTIDTKIDLPSLQLKVKPLPKDTLLIGDFTLTHTIKKHNAKVHEPIPMQVHIKGTGYPPILEKLLPKEGDFTRFTEKPIVKSFLRNNDTQSTVTYPIALSHTQSFTLSPIVIKAFDPKTQRAYTLTVPAQKFKIQEVEPHTLVDKVDSPDVLKEDWSWLRTLLSYILVFAAGYLTALSWKWKKRRSYKEDHPLIRKIQECKDEKSLLQVLMATDNKDLTPSIEQLESSLYGNGKIKFNKIKQDALEKIK